MDIVVLSASRHKNCTLKDVAGGFGTVFTVGDSPFARLLEIAKRRIAAIPNITLAYLDSLLTSHGASVRILDVRRADQLVPADLYLISSSIVDCNFERELGWEARSRFGARVGYFGTFASAVPDFYSESADFVLRGEIENMAPALARGDIPSGVVDAGFVGDLDALPDRRPDLLGDAAHDVGAQADLPAAEGFAGELEEDPAVGLGGGLVGHVVLPGSRAGSPDPSTGRPPAMTLPATPGPRDIRSPMWLLPLT